MKTINCVLLIDDNEHDNFFHSRVIMIANAAKQIKTVTMAEKALEYFELSKNNPTEYPFPDLILLDVNMPGMNGFDFLEAAKKKKIFDGEKPALVIMLSGGYLSSKDEKRAREEFSNEIRGFKNKPLSATALEEIIEKCF